MCLNTNMRVVLPAAIIILAFVAGCARADIAVDSASGMNFGNIVMDTASGDTLTLDAPTGSVTKAGSSLLSGATSAGSISVSGTPNAAISITPPPDENIGYTGGNVTLTNFNVTGGNVQSLNAGGTLSVGVGCELHYTSNISEGGPLNSSISFIFEYN